MDHALIEFAVINPRKDRGLMRRIRRQKEIRVVDQIEVQIQELFQFYNRKVTDNHAQYLQFRKRYLAGRLLDSVGVWVWYPWHRSLVHILPRADFQRLRTSRNRYLITDREQSRFNKSHVAIAGLSVGSSIASTLRLQGGAGSMSLADLDDLEVSNTNRIAAGINDLGEKKIEIVRKRLLDIEPFTVLRLFPHGLITRNVERFCARADVIFDEVDNLFVKIQLRQTARKLRIPLIMLTDNDDGVLVDYYPYHKSPRTPFFYGVPDHQILRAVNAKQSPTKEEVVKLSSRIVGPEHISERMIRSLKAVGKSLVSWPQLGTAAMLSGVVGAYMTRMIVNGHHFTFKRRLIRINDQLA